MELFELEQKLSEVQNNLVNCYTTLDEIWMYHPANPDFVNPIKMYDDLKKSEEDNPAIGLILCTEKDETIVKYSVLAENEKLFASKYRLYLPKEEELKKLIEQDKINFELDKE